MKRFWLAAALATCALTLGFKPVDAQEENLKFHLVPASDTIKTCLPDAKATVIVHLTEAKKGVDSLELHARGLPPNTTFAVFLTELPVPPFGAVQYIADFTTNKQGKGAVQVKAIIEEAFSSAVDTTLGRVRKELDHMVFWFADPAADDFCFTPPDTGPITPFEGDGEAGAAAMSSRNFLPNAPLP